MYLFSIVGGCSTAKSCTLTVALRFKWGEVLVRSSRTKIDSNFVPVAMRIIQRMITVEEQQ